MESFSFSQADKIYLHSHPSYKVLILILYQFYTNKQNLSFSCLALLSTFGSTDGSSENTASLAKHLMPSFVFTFCSMILPPTERSSVKDFRHVEKISHLTLCESDKQ